MTDYPLMKPLRTESIDTEEAGWIEASRSDPAAFDWLYDRHVARIYKYLYHRLGNHQDAEEITSQTFLSALEKLGGYVHHGNFIGWLITIARNKLTDFYRREHPQQELDEELSHSTVDDPLQTVMAHERKRQLQELIGSLSEEEQELLRLRFVAELSFREIGELMQKSESAAKKQIYRIILRLQEQAEVKHD